MKKITLSIGLFDKDTRKQEIATEEALRIIKDEVWVLGGATIIPGCIGVYKHDDGQIVMEPSIQVIFYDLDPRDVKTCARYLRSALNQESIAYEEQQVYSEFLDA